MKIFRIKGSWTKLLLLISFFIVLMSSKGREDKFVDKTHISKKNDTNTIHITLPDPFNIKFNLVSKNFKFDEFTVKKELAPYLPRCSNKKCSVYLGEFRVGSNMKAPITSLFMNIKFIEIETANIVHLKSFCKRLNGFHKELQKNQIDNISIFENQKGIKLTKINYILDGGKSYYYLIVHGKPSILFDNANWIDFETVEKI